MGWERTYLVKNRNEFFENFIGFDGTGPQAIIRFPEATLEGMVGMHNIQLQFEIDRPDNNNFNNNNNNRPTEARAEVDINFDNLRRNYP